MITDNVKSLFKKCTGVNAPWCISIPWPLWFRDFYGFTLGPLIFIKPGAHESIVVHEMVHVMQFYKQPFTFWIRYLVELYRKGYFENRFEKEAYSIQRKATEVSRDIKRA